jgi:hypothetical protein
MSDTLSVEFGAGGRRLTGWISHDLAHDGTDITKKLAYADNSVWRVRAEHVCEHITPSQFLDSLIECRRILKEGGTVRIMMPVLDRLPRNHAMDIVRGHGHQGVYTTWLIERFLQLAGFTCIQQTPRHVDDQHRHAMAAHYPPEWNRLSDQQLGDDRDELETARFEAVKLGTHTGWMP